jgi:MFS family permease
MGFSASEELNEEDVRYGLKTVIQDGLATQAMVTLTGGIFLVAFALKLGASNTTIGLLAAIPPLAELIQIPSIYIVERVRNRRLLCVGASAASRAFWLVIVAIPFVFPKALAIPVLVSSLCCYAGLSAISHCSWNSWMRDLIPQENLGSFFSTRMKFSTALAILLSLAAALFIDVWEFTYSSFEVNGYAVIFLFGYLAGMLGVYYLAKTPEPRMKCCEEHGFLQKIREPFKDRNYSKLLIFLGSWNFAVNLAAPFFTVYMLKRLDMDVTYVIALAVLSQIVSVFSFRLWGNAADRFSNKSVLRVSGPLFMVCILGWTFTTLPDVHLLTLPLLVVIHIFLGISTAGVTLAAGNIGLKLAPRGSATAYLATASFTNSLAAGIAPVFGGLFADFFAARELSLTLTWQSPVRFLSFETLDFQQWDFFFFFAFIIGLFSLHRLTHVQEEGDVKEKIVIQELLTTVRREMRNFSTAGGIRQMVNLPFVQARDARRIPEAYPVSPTTIGLPVPDSAPDSREGTVEYRELQTVQSS